MIRKLEHVGLMTTDIQKSISFYTEVLGFNLLGTLDHSNGMMKLAFLGIGDSPETQIELIQGYNDSLPAEGRVHHIAL
ncbi:MAG TPA: VOC family protein, partial [Chondromyces sp.]|nr:VOC family protein [Chondromyces sp.]